MTFEEYLERRESKRFTQGEVADILKKCGYCYKFMNTLVSPRECKWEYGKGAASQKVIRKEYEGKIPYHFAYIKFYEEDGEQFALVAGKTNFGTLDFDFSLKITSSTEKGDQARCFLRDKKRTKEGCTWYCQKVLAVWKEGQALERKDEESQRYGPQAIEAEEVERDIGGLFGLWGS